MLGSYAAHDHYANVNQAKKACIRIPSPAVRDCRLRLDDYLYPPLRSGPLSQKG
jgi:hypothetical protein